jgi:hypothetical protein
MFNWMIATLLPCNFAGLNQPPCIPAPLLPDNTISGPLGWHLHRQMKMIEHEYVGKNLPASLGARFAQDLDETAPVMNPFSVKGLLRITFCEALPFCIAAYDDDVCPNLSDMSK